MFLNVSDLSKVNSAKLATDWKIIDSTAGAITAPVVTKNNGDTIRMPARELPEVPGFFGGQLPNPVRTSSTGTVTPVTFGLVETIGDVNLKFRAYGSTNISIPNVPPYNRRTMFWKHDGYTTQTVTITSSRLVCQKCYSTCYNSCWGGSLGSPQRDAYEIAIIPEGGNCPNGSTVLLSSRVCVPLSVFPWMYCTLSCYSYYNCEPYPCEPSVDCNCAQQAANSSYSVAQTRYVRHFWSFENWYLYATVIVDGTFAP